MNIIAEKSKFNKLLYNCNVQALYFYYSVLEFNE